jgi:hypothetical protein
MRAIFIREGRQLVAKNVPGYFTSPGRRLLLACAALGEN